MRQIIILSHLPENLLTGNGVYLSYSPLQPNAMALKQVLFNNAKSLLGQEFPYAIYDMRAENGICLNLEALAIVAGTIQRGGRLYLLCPDWETLEDCVDMDSVRWNDGKAICTPNFYRYFKTLVNGEKSPLPPLFKREELVARSDLTTEQQFIFENLPLDPASIHLITAPRGRGKSTLSGKLAERLSQQHKVLMTARSHAVLPSFWKQIKEADIPFLAPDLLLAQIQQGKISADRCLFIDEAASLPLPLLHQFCAYFDKVILTTTTQNYEGTGRGFSLKFLPQLKRSYRQWQLTQPLRWNKNDPLERFITELLLLDDFVPPFTKRGLGGILNFYQLLAQAHYKTTPSDLRRLFDADNQNIETIEQEGNLIGGLWAMKEGGLSEDLTQAIWRGERRPQGSLVAQYLCFQGNLPEACQLKSARISRIAVEPQYQNQGYGKQLVLQFFTQIQPLVDFVSVSFGLNKHLLAFWQSCGFQLVQVTPSVEASSGLPSAMMIKASSPHGEDFVQRAIQQFKRDMPFLPFFMAEIQGYEANALVSPDNLELQASDWQNIRGFILHHRTLSACLVSLKRLYASDPERFQILSDLTPPATHIKAWQTQLKQQLAKILAIMP